MPKSLPLLDPTASPEEIKQFRNMVAAGWFLYVTAYSCVVNNDTCPDLVDFRKTANDVAETALRMLENRK
jgi:hypothetical protein